MNRDPLQPIIARIASLLKFAEEHASTPVKKEAIDPELQKRMMNLKNSIEKFKELVEQRLAEEGLNTQEIYKKLKEHPEEYTLREQKTLRDIANLGVHAMVLRLGLAQARAKASLSKHEKGDKKKAVRKRRGKFKGMNNGSKWKRL